MVDGEFNLKEYLTAYSDVSLEQFAKALMNNMDATEGLDEWLNRLTYSGAKIVLDEIGEDKKIQMLFTVTIMGQILAAIHLTQPASANLLRDMLKNETQREAIIRLISMAVTCGIGLAVTEEWR